MTYDVPLTALGTEEEKKAALDEIWSTHQKHLANGAVIDEFLNELEAQGKANLEARENG
jgi:hypothetical protein